jgi:RNA polymerase sigma-70 factor (ECF subfamily)
MVLSGLKLGRPGRYLLQAAIAAIHAEAPSSEETDWPQILAFYDALLVAWPSPVVALNRAVALSRVRGPAEALTEVDRLATDPRLATYHYLPAIRADLLRRLNRPGEAADALGTALALATNAAEQEYLRSQLAELS